VKPEELFRAMCDAAKLEQAVKALNEPQLSRLILWLRERQPVSGIPALVLGVAEAAAVERFLQACPP
jgi:hypothetical protein